MSDPKNQNPSSSQPAIPPLNPESLVLIPDVIKLFHIILNNIPLYPEGSDMISAPLNELMEKLSSVFSRDPRIVFNHVEGALLVNGARFKEGEAKKNQWAAFLKFFVNLNLHSISFLKGVTEEELIKFIKMLRKGAADKNIIKTLKLEGIEHIIIDEIIYGVLSDKNASGSASLQGEGLLHYLASRILTTQEGKDILAVMEKNPKQMSDALDNLENKKSSDGTDLTQANVLLELLQKLSRALVESPPQEWTNAKKSFSKTLAHLKPAQRSKIFLDAKTDDEIKVVQEIVREIPDDVFVDMVTDLYRERMVSTKELSDVVKNFGQQDKKEILASLHEKLIKAGLSAREADQITALENFDELPLNEKIERLLNSSLKDYLALRPQIKFSKFLDEINQANRKDILYQLLSRWQSSYGGEPETVRKDILRDILMIIENSFCQNQEVLANLINVSCETVRAENIRELVERFLESWVRQLAKFVTEKNFSLFFICYISLRKHLATFQIKDADKLFIQTIVKMFDRNLWKALMEGFQSGFQDLRHDFLEFFGTIGESLVPLFVEKEMERVDPKEMIYFDAFLRRRMVAEALFAIIEKHGSSAVSNHLKKQLNQSDQNVVKNAVDLLSDIRHPELISLYEYPLYHEDGAIQRKAIFMLTKLGGPQSVNLLNGALTDQKKMLEVRLDIIHALGKIGDVASLKLLQGLPSTEDNGAVEEAIAAIQERVQKQKIK